MADVKTKEQILDEVVGAAYYNPNKQGTKLVFEYDALAAMSSWEQQQTSLLREENKRLREGLIKIASPISAMQKELKEGERLNGAYAIQLSNDANYLKGIAKSLLTPEENK